MNNKATFFVPVNPLPWKTPPFVPVRVRGKWVTKAGRNNEAHDFKEAVKESLISQGATMLPGPRYRVHLAFWRRLDKYTDSIGRILTKNWADSTNMQKLTEDALQGILFKNDRDNVMVSGQIIAQDTLTSPGVLIMCQGGSFGDGFSWIPEGWSKEEIDACLSNAARKEGPKPDSSQNSWPPRL